MTVKLCNQVNLRFCNASNYEEFFDDEQRKKIRTFEKIQQYPTGPSYGTCKNHLFFGFFFDGTKNNYIQAEKNKTHSNIARLYDCYPGQSVSGVLPNNTNWEYNPTRYKHFFRMYIPGVGSPFDQINDGEG